MRTIGYILIQTNTVETEYTMYSENEVIDYANKDAQSKYAETFKDVPVTKDIDTITIYFMCMPVVNDMETATLYLKRQGIVVTTIIQ